GGAPAGAARARRPGGDELARRARAGAPAAGRGADRRPGARPDARGGARAGAGAHRGRGGGAAGAAAAPRPPAAPRAGVLGPQGVVAGGPALAGRAALGAADSRAKRNGSSEADLHVFAKLFEQGLERGEEAEALPRPQVVAEHDLLRLGVAQRVEV